MVRVLSLGETLVDILVEDRMANWPEELAMRAYPGGSPANVAAALSCLGVESWLVTLLGQDLFGEMIRTALSELGVNRDFVFRLEMNTMQALIKLDSEGIPGYSFLRDSRIERLLPAVDPDISLSDFDLIHCGSLGLAYRAESDFFMEIIRKAQKQGIPVALDPNIRHLPGIDKDYYHRLLEELMGAVSLLKASKEDLEILFGTDYLSVLREIRPEGSTFVTLGAEGALVLSGARREVVEQNCQEEVVDTTGCGDVFMASILAFLFQEGRREWGFKRLLEAAHRGNRAAGWAARYQGALAGIKGLSELEE